MRKSADPNRRMTDPGGGEAGKFSSFIYAVFVAVVLGVGGIIWGLISANAMLDKRVTLLEFRCARGVP